MSMLRLLVTCLIILFAVSLANAQIPPGGQVVRGTGGGGFNVKGPPDQLPAIRSLLDVSDDEWKIVSPKVEKVLRAKQAMSTGAGMIWSSSNNAKPTYHASTTQVETEPSRAMQELRDQAADENASKDQLAAKVAADRKTNQKARPECEAAQQERADSVTPRQLVQPMTLGVVE